jgi:BirA family biotin operon repressor/biotin-[acetyl-CoA-carboxylase] ligase
MNLSQNKRQGIGHPFIELQSVDSTNNYAMAQVHAGMAFHGAAFFTHEQTAGKGQRGRTWMSTPGENILLSIVLEPQFMQIAKPFMLSATLALACRDFYSKYSKGEIFIKWPNDIYWRDRKAGGILIESIIRGGQWLIAIAGIGININQISFSPLLLNPVSLKQITGKTFLAIELAKELCVFLEERYQELQTKGPDCLLAEYNQALYKRNDLVRFKKDQTVFETVIREVNPEGCLITDDIIERSFDFGEVEWLL